jgi:hypothetical protein
MLGNTNKMVENQKRIDIQKRIDKNRDEIDKWLNGDYPIGLVYIRIRMLSAQNKMLIDKLNLKIK